MNREDISERKILEENYDVEEASYSYNNSSWIVHDFFENELLAKKTLDELKIHENARECAALFSNALKLYLEHKISKKEFSDFRINAWNEVDHREGNEKKLFRVIVSSLYDEEYRNNEREVAPLNYFEVIFSTTYKLDKGLCKKFREFCERHPAMQHFRYSSQG
ncbi:hypothetical protein SAMN02745857_03985 [Andreprevotia lacus DSM 23236]|jgi:hypothetical protein|uniref:Uncharacterized protein n=1 Tax=Andreprevotia lacus DSM 23236 TaxID=1121001 RepID=A0A1W1Y0A0_9NEIS|nr:hypothetical protein [Andreprevotia lacus]SMC29649.1 hypothetical protein SAMN02745857_03985 [Andreprevotia lacus DSM 23236]